MRKVTKEQAELWREQYEAGESLHDLHAKEAAKGSNVSPQFIGKSIMLVGGTIRTVTESIRLAKKKYEDTLRE